MVNLKKRKQVEFLVDLLKKNPHLMLVNFEKTSHRTLEKLRRELKNKKAYFKVIKNTLFGKAINQLIKTNPILLQFKKEFLPLKYPSAIITFAGDWFEGLKTFYNFSQEEKTLNFKSAIFDNQIYERSKLLQLAVLPSKNQILSTIIGAFKNPLNRFLYAGKFNINKLVYILKEKGGETIHE